MLIFLYCSHEYFQIFWDFIQFVIAQLKKVAKP